METERAEFSISELAREFSALPSLTSLACFTCLQMWGVNTSLHIATASAAFVFCSRRILGSPD
jgi:hypothetical protein